MFVGQVSLFTPMAHWKVHHEKEIGIFEKINYLKIFENTEEDFDGVRLGVADVGWVGRLVVVEVDFTEDESGELATVVCDSGCLIVFAASAAWCTSVAGIGGGNGIFDDKVFSISFDVGNCIDEFDDKDDDGEGKIAFILIAGVDTSSSIVLEATVRSRSFRTSRTVRWNNCWTYS